MPAARATGTFLNSPILLDNGTSINGAGFAVVGGATVTISGTVTVQNLRLAGGYSSSGAIAGPGTLNISHMFSWTGAGLHGPGVVNILSGATLTISDVGGKFLRGGTLNNAGTVNVLAGYGFGASQGAVAGIVTGTRGTFLLRRLRVAPADLYWPLATAGELLRQRPARLL